MRWLRWGLAWEHMPLVKCWRLSFFLFLFSPVKRSLRYAYISSVHDTVLHTACRINPPRTDASLKFGAPNFYVVDNCWQPWCCTQNHKWGGVSYPVVEPSLLSKNIETETWHGYKWRFLKSWGIPKSPWVSMLSDGHPWLGWFGVPSMTSDTSIYHNIHYIYLYMAPHILT